MKKFYSCLVAVVAILALVACGEKQPTDPDSPTTNPNADATITMTYSNQKATTIDYVATPSNKTLTWSFLYLPTEGDQGFNTTMGSMTDEEIIADLVAYYEQVIEMYAQYGQTLTIDDFVSEGDDNGTLEGLTPETGYTVLAVYLDGEGKSCNNKVFKSNFTTAALQRVDMTFDCRVDTTTGTLFINPSVTTQDFFACMYDCDTAAASTYTADMSDEELAEAMLSQLGNYGYLSYYTFKGNQTIDLDTEVGNWEERAGTFNLMYMLGAIEGANFISDVYIYKFTYTLTEYDPAPQLVSVKCVGKTSNVNINKHAFVK